MPVAHTSRLRIEKHKGPHRTAHFGDFAEPVHFGMHGGIKDFYQNKYGRTIEGPNIRPPSGLYDRRRRGVTDRHPGGRTGGAGA